MPRPPRTGHRGPVQHARASAGPIRGRLEGHLLTWVSVHAAAWGLSLDAQDAVADSYALALETDADTRAEEGVVVPAATVVVMAAACDVRQILVVETAQGLLRQLEFL